MPRAEHPPDWFRTLDQVAVELVPEEPVSRERIRQIQRVAVGKLSVYATEQLGRPPQDIDEVLQCFTPGPDPEGVSRAWRRHRRQIKSKTA